MKALQKESKNYLNSLIKQKENSLVSLLQDIQGKYRYLPEDVLREIAKQKNIPLIDIYRVATFYKSFSLEPKGKHIIQTCTGTACHVRGSEKVTEEISHSLGIKPGETAKDGLYSLETVNCVGACALAPLVMVNEDPHGNMTPIKAANLIKGLKEKEKTAVSEIKPLSESKLNLKNQQGGFYGHLKNQD